MPIYEFDCEECGNTFSVRMSMAEHEQMAVACPACKGNKVLPHYSIFYAKTSKKTGPGGGRSDSTCGNRTCSNNR